MSLPENPSKTDSASRKEIASASMRFIVNFAIVMAAISLWNSDEMASRVETFGEWARPVASIVFENSPMKVASSKVASIKAAAKGSACEPAVPAEQSKSDLCLGMDNRHPSDQKDQKDVEKRASPVKSAPAETDEAMPAAASDPREGEKTILFVGDSFSNGYAAAAIAPAKKAGYRVRDMGRHSTGLVVRSYFDWTAAMASQCKSGNPVAAVAISLGANDPQDMVVGKETFRFGSEKWTEEYVARTAALIREAKSCSSSVLLFELPRMKTERYESSMDKIRQAQKRGAETAGAEILESGFLGQCCSAFSYVSTETGKTIRARDGIHLAPEGYLSMAKALLERLGKMTDKGQ